MKCLLSYYFTLSATYSENSGTTVQPMEHLNHSFNKFLLSTYYIAGKTATTCPWGAHSLEGKTET